jgi:hypothetical protein
MQERAHKIEEKRLEKEARIEREKARIQGIMDSEIPWDRIVELECEYADENEDFCYIKKYVMCDISRKDIWTNNEVTGVIISGDDFGKTVTLKIGEDFYGKRQVSFWDSFDYVWYSYGDIPSLIGNTFKSIRELNDYVNLFNQNRINGVSGDSSVKIKK